MDNVFKNQNEPVPAISAENSSFYQIPMESINPYYAIEPESTTFILGSPGSGKSRLLMRLRDESGGTLAIESGIFDLFQRHADEYVRRKRAGGYMGEVTDFFLRTGRGPFADRDPEFDLPEIDGFDISHCYAMSTPLDKTLEDYAKEMPLRDANGQDAICRNLPYSGRGALHYRESIGSEIASGGKSGFPDWLFLPKANGSYVQLISFPGHRRISAAMENKSIPKIPNPSSAVYLVDPLIDSYHHDGRKRGYENPALNAVRLHLADVKEMERKGVEVQWFLSKTPPELLEENRQKAERIYFSEKMIEIVRRLPNMRGFDSFVSSREEIYKKLRKVANIL